MFQNVGKKMQALAVLFYILGIIGSIVWGIVLCAGGAVLLGLVVIAFGWIGSWISVLGVYGIGIVVEDAERARSNTASYSGAISKTPSCNNASNQIKHLSADQAKKEGRCSFCGTMNSAYDTRCSGCGAQLKR